MVPDTVAEGPDAVAHGCSNGESKLTVRARVASDLERPMSGYMPALSPTQTLTWSDYRYRTIIGREDFAMGLAQIAVDIDYLNFKNEVAKVSVLLVL